MSNDLFWKVVDKFENGQITEKQARDFFLLANHGDIDETNADMDLLLKKE